MPRTQQQQRSLLWKKPTLEIAPETHGGMACPVRVVNLYIIYLLIEYMQLYYIY